MRQRRTPVGRKLAMTAKVVGSGFNAALAATGGSLPTWLILAALQEREWSTQLDLAREVGIEGPTLNRHLDNFERLGYVTRTRSATDRRAVSVEITDAGRAAHARMLEAVVAFNKRLVAGISQDDLRRLDDTLTRLAANAGGSGARRRTSS